MLQKTKADLSCSSTLIYLLTNISIFYRNTYKSEVNEKKYSVEDSKNFEQFSFSWRDYIADVQFPAKEQFWVWKGMEQFWRLFQQSRTQILNIWQRLKAGASKIGYGVCKGRKFWKEKSSLPSDLKIRIFKSETIFCNGNISLKYYDQDKISIRKNILIGSTSQRVFADDLFDPTKAKRYSVVLVEMEDKFYLIARVSFLFYLETMTN